MRRFFLILASTLLIVSGCTEENTGSNGWDVGDDDTGIQNDAGDTGTDGGDTSSPDTQADTIDSEPDVIPDTDPPTDTSECGAVDQMCDWECYEQDPDCETCPAPSEFTTGPFTPDECTRVDFACDANSDPYFDETCGCGCLPANDPCTAQDARGEGACRAIIGVKWNGHSCEQLTGCDCVGEDCDQLYMDLRSCTDAHAECPSGECARMDVRGQGLCDLVLGYAWTGPEGGCQSISGCECEGSDCDKLYDTPEACQNDFRECRGEIECGGFGGKQCPEDMFCDYPDNNCGAADGMGVCEPRPTACPEVVREVCGCDGQIHTNECFAHSSGVDIYQDKDFCRR